MLAVLLFHKGNQDQALSVCERVKKLGGVEKHRILLATDSGDCHELARVLDGVFSEVLLYTAHESPTGWPARENALHGNVVREIHYVHKCPWLRMEADSVPLKASWLDEIEAAYKQAEKPILAGTNGHPGRFCGVSVFPGDAMEYSLAMMMPISVWYADGYSELMSHSAVTELMSEIPTEQTVIQARVQNVGNGDSERTCIVQLGRMGDVLNILPLVKHISYTEGKPVLMVHKDYAGIEVDYCDLDIWDRGEWSDLSLAVHDARDKYKRVIVAQIHGDRWQTERKCPSFCIESWRQAGYLEEFGKHPLVFDRSLDREADLLIDSPDVNRKTVLINTNGTSSPFANGHELRQLAESTGRQVVDLSGIKADKFQDILALYDNAGLLITIDTATLHLAQASDIPVISLVADKPTKWHQSAQKGNEILRVKYSDFDKKREEIKAAIESVFSNRNVIHVYQDFDAQGETKRRNDFARSTWNYPDFVTAQPVREFKRDSSIIGDERRLPFIKDIIDSVHANDNDVIVFTNTDTCLRKGFWWEAMRLDKALHGHRYDFKTISRPLDVTEITTGKWYPGSDIFAFTKSWWDARRDEFPDMILGAEAWDKIMRTMVKHYGGDETFAACYHEQHYSTWLKVRKNDASNRHSRILAKQWLAAKNYPIEELGNFDDDPPEVVTGKSIPKEEEKPNRKRGRRATRLRGR
jgi:hypothetical protein